MISLPFKREDKVLELGGGENPLFHPNMDARPLPTVDIVWNLEEFPFPVEDESYDGVFSSYLIEHISWRKIKDFIKEVYRVLKPGGKAVFVTANLLEQARKLVEKSHWTSTDICMVFGDQNYPENVHKCGFSPEYAERLFKEVGFERVEIHPHPLCETDMVITAYKPQRKLGIDVEKAYDRSYFEGRVYKGLYRDFPCHWKTVEVIMERRPESVLELGGARGYVTKKLEALGVRAVCVDVSKHCWHTRATDSFLLWDVTKTPWPFKDKEFDLCFSKDFMEHLPEDKLQDVIKEMARVSKRGLHGITFADHPFARDDPTHLTLRSKEWWENLFKSTVPDYPVEIIDKEEMEREPNIAKYASADGLLKLNIGSFLDMYHYGWINIDVQDLSQWAQLNGYIFKKLDVLEGLPYAENSVDIILASHFIEHLTREEGLKFLRECHRVLKPNGIIRLVVPDAELLVKKYLKGEIMEYRHVNVGVENAQDEAEALFHLLLAGHKTIYDFKSLKKLLEKAGFTKIKRMPPFKSQSKVIEKQTIPMYPTLSLYVEAKPKKRLPKVVTARKGKLRIGLISTPFFGVPPSGYSGLEMMVWNLACALGRMGHEVVLFAPKGSRAPPRGRLAYIFQTRLCPSNF